MTLIYSFHFIREEDGYKKFENKLDFPIYHENMNVKIIMTIHNSCYRKMKVSEIIILRAYRTKVKLDNLHNNFQ